MTSLTVSYIRLSSLSRRRGVAPNCPCAKKNAFFEECSGGNECARGIDGGSDTTACVMHVLVDWVRA